MNSLMSQILPYFFQVWNFGAKTLESKMSEAHQVDGRDQAYKWQSPPIAIDIHLFEEVVSY